MGNDAQMALLSSMVILYIVGVAACTSANKQSRPNLTIPLKLEIRSQSSNPLAWATIIVDSEPRVVLVDTGSPESLLSKADFSQNPSVGLSSSTGISGITEACDKVIIGEVVVGSNRFSDFEVMRCNRNILGLDLLGNSVVEIDFSKSTLKQLTTLPQKTPRRALRRLHRGHITIPGTIGMSTISVLFDTGADATVFDLKYVQSNSDYFKLLKNEVGYDAHGNEIPSLVYMCRSLQIGGLVFENVEVAAFDFGEQLRSKMDGVSVILGTNIISRAVWGIDLKTNMWTVNAY